MMPTIYPKEYQNSAKFMQKLFLLSQRFGNVKIVSPTGRTYYLTQTNKLNQLQNRSIKYRNQARRNRMMPPY